MEPTDPVVTPEDVHPVENEGETLLAGLNAENEALRAQLEEVMATAATNERIWRHFAEIERILFRTRELDLLVEELLGELKKRFQTDQVILFLCHPDILERFFPDLSETREPVNEGTWIVSLPTEIGNTLWGVSPKPFLLAGDNIEELLEYLPEAAAPVRSGVMIPLSIHEILFGGLFLGSMDADRYRPKDGTDLLEQLGIKVALAMDNCLTYEKVKDFGIEDPVTGLLSFFQIHTVLEREFRRSRRTGEPLSLLIIDFNFVHELEEFDSGTDVLKHVAGLLSGILPEKESFLGRYGSDEFILVLPGVEEDEAREVVPYLTRAIRKAPFKHRNTAILIQAVIGAATLANDMKRPQEMLDSAYAELARLKALHHPEPAEE